MADTYTYSNWRSAATLEEKIAQGYLFIDELQQRIGKERSSDGFQESAYVLAQRIAATERSIERYEDRLAARGAKGGGMTFVQPGSARRTS